MELNLGNTKLVQRVSVKLSIESCQYKQQTGFGTSRLFTEGGDTG